jgi:tryptophan synthase beta chain
MHDKLTGTSNSRFIAVEPASCPSLTRGKYAYDFCDTGKMTPLARMYTLGSDFIPSPNHAGGLRYHGMSPILSKLYHDGLWMAISLSRTRYSKQKLNSANLSRYSCAESSHAFWRLKGSAKC